MQMDHIQTPVFFPSVLPLVELPGLLAQSLITYGAFYHGFINFALSSYVLSYLGPTFGSVTALYASSPY